jgi:methylglutaconyl-CoA hydratase
VLEADGADFCAGADLEALERMIDAPPEEHRRDAEALARVFSALREVPQPVVAVVRGKALAGGAGLASACDMVLAHEGAQFGYPEVRVGFVPAMVMTMLRRCMGEKRAFDLVASGRLLDASQAVQAGLASRCFHDASFALEVEETIAQLARTPASALRLTKRLFYALDGQDFGAGLALGAATNVEARATEDFKAGIRRFVRRDQSRT